MQYSKSSSNSGGVYRRKDSPFWWIWFYDSTGKRSSLSSKTKDKTLAHVELNRILNALKRGKRPVIRHDPLSRIEDQLMTSLRQQERLGQKETKTVLTDLSRVRVFIDYCHERDVRNTDEIDSEILQDYLTWLVDRRGCTRPTANRYVDAIRGVVPQKIALKKYRENPGRGQEIPQELIEQILEVADPVFRLFLILLAETGLRTGHLCNAESAWVQTHRFKETKRKFLVFPPSASNSRKSAPLVPLNDTAAAVIDQLPCRKKFLFDNGNGYPLYTKDKVYDRWRTIKHRLGFENYRPYDLRHTFAIREIIRTGDVYYVSKSLGHKSATTTLNYYQHLSNARLAEQASGASITGIKPKDLK